MDWDPTMPVVIEPVNGGPRHIVEVSTPVDAAILLARGYRFPRLDLGRVLSQWGAADGEDDGAEGP